MRQSAEQSHIHQPMNGILIFKSNSLFKSNRSASILSHIFVNAFVFLITFLRVANRLPSELIAQKGTGFHPSGRSRLLSDSI